MAEVSLVEGLQEDIRCLKGYRISREMKREFKKLFRKTGWLSGEVLKQRLLEDNALLEWENVLREEALKRLRYLF